MVVGFQNRSSPEECSPSRSNGHEEFLDHGQAEQGEMKYVFESKKTPEAPVTPPDGGWGWICAIAAAIPLFLQNGLVRNFSLIYEALREQHKSSASLTAWVYSTNVACLYLSAPIIAAAVRRFSYRSVAFVGSIMITTGMTTTAFAPSIPFACLTYGVIMGLGYGAITTQRPIILAEWFHFRLGRVSSLVACFGGFGAILMPILLKYLLDQYGNHGTWMILGAIWLHMIVGAFVWRSPRANEWHGSPGHKIETENKRKQHCSNNPQIEENEVPSGVDEGTPVNRYQEPTGFRYYFDYTLILQPRMLTFSLMRTAISAVLGVTNIGVAGLNDERGFSQTQLAILMTTMGVINMLSRLLSGFITDSARVRAKRTDIFCLLCLLIGGVVILLPTAKTVATFFTAWIWYIAIICFVTTQVDVILSDLVTRQEYASAVAMTRIFAALGALLGPTLGGYLKDVSGRYDYTFYLVGIVISFATSSFYACLVIHRIRQRKVNH